jgi:uncharacterized protein (DUF983 family)
MTRSMARTLRDECPRCAEPVLAGDTACDFCGHPIRPRRPALLRAIEVASLGAVVAVIVLLCRWIGIALNL